MKLVIQDPTKNFGSAFRWVCSSFHWLQLLHLVKWIRLIWSQISDQVNQLLHANPQRHSDVLLFVMELLFLLFFASHCWNVEEVELRLHLLLYVLRCKVIDRQLIEKAPLRQDASSSKLPKVLVFCLALICQGSPGSLFGPDWSAMLLGWRPSGAGEGNWPDRCCWHCWKTSCHISTFETRWQLERVQFSKHGAWILWRESSHLVQLVGGFPSWCQ